MSNECKTKCVCRWTVQWMLAWFKAAMCIITIQGDLADKGEKNGKKVSKSNYRTWNEPTLPVGSPSIPGPSKADPHACWEIPYVTTVNVSHPLRVLPVKWSVKWAHLASPPASCSWHGLFCQTHTVPAPQPIIQEASSSLTDSHYTRHPYV